MEVERGLFEWIMSIADDCHWLKVWCAIHTVLITVLIVLCCVACAVMAVEGGRSKTGAEGVEVRPENADFLLGKPTEEKVRMALEHYGFPDAGLITAQAVLETGNFRSRNCVERNNIFGLYDSKRGRYMEFETWADCVIAYGELVLCKRMEGEDHLAFLRRIGYAEDPLYEEKLAGIAGREKTTDYCE